MTDDEATASQRTIDALLDASKRDHLPLAHAFLQRRTKRGTPRPGVLADFVAVGAERPFAQYLLLHAAASGTDFSVARDSRVWARAMGMDHTRQSSRIAVSRNWAWLEDHRLITRRRHGRTSQITLLRDDGSGKRYKHPATLRMPYVRLPYAYWREGWYMKLHLASTALLLIGLSLRDGFILPHRQVQAWYGMSPSTLTKAIKGLRENGLLDVRRDRKDAPLAPEGYTWEHSYTLQPPFGPRGRRPGK